MTHSRPWPEMNPDERKAAVKDLAAKGLTYQRIADELSAPSNGAISGIISRMRRAGEMKGWRKRGPKVTKPAATSRRRPASPKPTGDIVQDWLARHGGPRRFERGVSDDLVHLTDFAAKRGYQIKFTQRGTTPYVVTGCRGGPRKLTRAGLFQFIDELRLADGLQPFNPPKDIRHGTRA